MEPNRPIIAVVLAPRGLNRRHAAAYIGVSPSTFDKLIADGLMPGPKRIYSRTVWDQRALDKAFDVLPGDASGAEEDWEVA